MSSLYLLNIRIIEKINNNTKEIVNLYRQKDFVKPQIDE